MLSLARTHTSSSSPHKVCSANYSLFSQGVFACVASAQRPLAARAAPSVCRRRRAKLRCRLRSTALPPCVCVRRVWFNLCSGRVGDFSFVAVLHKQDCAVRRTGEGRSVEPNPVLLFSCTLWHAVRTPNSVAFRAVNRYLCVLWRNCYVLFYTISHGDVYLLSMPLWTMDQGMDCHPHWI